MTIVQQIKSYLQNGGTFVDGVLLLKRAGRDVSSFERYTKGNYVPISVDDSLIAALQHFLESRQEVSEFATIVQNSDTSMSEIPSNVGNLVKAPEPPSIIALRAQGRMMHKKHSVLHEAMRNAKTDSERYEIAKEIMDSHIPKTDAIYNQIRKWEKEGVEPGMPGKEDVIKETVAKMKRVGVLRPRISRLKNWLRDTKLDDVKRQKFEVELVDKDTELKGLENELKL